MTVSGGDFNYGPHLSADWASTDSTSLGLGFVTGGSDVGPDELTGMVRINMTNPENPSWVNLTNSQVPLTYEGSMEFLPYGDEGILIAFGGFDVSPPMSLSSDVG